MFSLISTTLYSILSLYGLRAWGNTYSTTINLIFVLQKKAIRIIPFSDYCDHTNLIFSKLNIPKLPDLIYFHNTNSQLQHKTSIKLSFCLPQVRANYGKFSIRYTGAKVWSSTDEQINNLEKRRFQRKLKDNQSARDL